MGLPHFAKSLLNMGDINHRFEVWYAGSREGRYVFDDTSQAMREELRPFGIALHKKAGECLPNLLPANLM